MLVERERYTVVEEKVAKVEMWILQVMLVKMVQVLWVLITMVQLSILQVVD